MYVDMKQLCCSFGTYAAMSLYQIIVLHSSLAVLWCAVPCCAAGQLGWKPLLSSYMRTLPDTIDEENRKLIVDLFNWLVQPCLGMGVCAAICMCVCGEGGICGCCLARSSAGWY